MPKLPSIKPTPTPKSGGGTAAKFLGQTSAATSVTGRASSFFGRWQMRMMKFGLLAGIGGFLSRLGNSDRITRNEKVDKTAGRALRGVGDAMTVPGRVTHMSMDEIAHGSRTADLADKHLGAGARNLVEGAQKGIAMLGRKTATTIGSVLEVADKHLDLTGRADRGIARQGVKIDKLAQKASEESSGLLGGILRDLKGVEKNIGSRNPMEAEVEVSEILAKMKSVEGATRKEKGRITAYANAILDKGEKLNAREFWKAPASTVKNRMKNMTVEDAVVTATTIANQAYTLHDACTRLGGSVRSLKLLIADVTGQKPQNISTWKALFGKADNPVVKLARKKIWGGIMPNVGITLATTFGYGYLSKGVGKVVNHRQNRFMHGMLTNAAYMGINQLGNMLEGHHSLLDVYADAKVKQEHGETVGPNDYMALLMAGAPQLQETLKASGANAAMLASHYAISKTPVSEVMADIGKGAEHLKTLTHGVHPQIWQHYQPEKPQPGMQQQPEAGWVERTGGTPDKKQSPLATAYKKEPNNAGGYGEMIKMQDRNTATSELRA